MTPEASAAAGPPVASATEALSAASATVASAHVASSYAALHVEAARLLKELSATSEVLVLAASKGAAGDFVRQSAAGGFLGVHTLTLAHLAAALATRQVSSRQLTPLSTLSQEALVARVVYENRTRLDYFGPVADRPGFIGALSRTLLELRLDEIELAQLAATGAPGEDLARLAAAYQRELETQSLADLAQLYRLALETKSHHLLHLPTILLDVPIRTRLSKRLIAKLSQVHAFTLSADE